MTPRRCKTALNYAFNDITSKIFIDAQATSNYSGEESSTSLPQFWTHRVTHRSSDTLTQKEIGTATHY